MDVKFWFVYVPHCDIQFMQIELFMRPCITCDPIRYALLCNVIELFMHSCKTEDELPDSSSGDAPLYYKV